MVDTRLLPMNAERARQESFGVNLQDCRDGLDKALNEKGLSRNQWTSSSAYNAGQAVTLLEMSGYSFSVDTMGIYTIEIIRSLRSEVHYIDIEPIQDVDERVQFEQGRYDALMELLGQE